MERLNFYLTSFILLNKKCFYHVKETKLAPCCPFAHDFSFADHVSWIYFCSKDPMAAGDYRCWVFDHCMGLFDVKQRMINFQTAVKSEIENTIIKPMNDEIAVFKSFTFNTEESALFTR